MSRRRTWNLCAFIVCCATGALLAWSGCGGKGECGDGIDNDGDGLVDGLDPGCAYNGDAESPDPDYPACMDSVDNDGDGKIDFPDDPGCTSEDDEDEYNLPIPACRDGVDNDMDGQTDYPHDPGCNVSLDDDEADDCPDGPKCPRCANGMDDDGDGEADYPDDLGCASAADNDEFNSDSSVCGANVSLTPLDPDGSATGFLMVGGTSALVSPTCGGTGTEVAYEYHAESPVSIVASTDDPETQVDTVVYVRSNCGDPDTELGCNDDVATDNTSSAVTVDRLEPGDYYIVVDAQNNGAGGSFKLQVTSYIAQGEVCDPASTTMTCAPGMFCRKLTPAAADTTCEPPACSDGMNNDGDSKIDYPDDPGCTGPDDDTENDTCPGGASCPECGNGMDDDGDGKTDYPTDTGCNSAGDPTEEDCDEQDPITALTQPMVTGNTNTLHDDQSGNCGGGSANDKVYRLVVPGKLTSLHLDTAGSAFDTVLYVKSPTCDVASLSCNDDGGAGNTSSLNMSNVAAGTYYVIVDGYLTSKGAFTLNAHGVITAGQNCDAAQVTSGLMSCATGTCTGGKCQ